MKKILMIDDEKQYIENFKEYFEDEFEIEGCLNGTKGLEKLNKGKYDLVILDLKLPGLSGVKLWKTIMQTKNVPLIIFTALPLKSMLSVANEYGCNDYIEKKYSLDFIASRICNILGCGLNGNKLVAERPKMV